MKFYVTFFCILMLLLVPTFLFPQLNPKWSGGVTMTPTTPNPGNAVTFTASLWIRNAAVENLRVIGGVDGVNIYDNTFASLRRGALQELNFTWIAAPGEHRAFFQIDPDDTIVEDATDNTVEISFFIGGAPETPINIYFSHNSVAPVREVSGEESFINYHMNIGEPTTTAFDIIVALRVNGRQIDTRTHRIIDPTTSVEFVGQFTWHTECGATVEVVIDPTNAIPETNEADNTWTHPVACVEPYRPNLIVSQYLVNWTPSLFSAGDRVTINYTTNNIGEEAAGAYKTGLKVGDTIVSRTSHAGHSSGTTSTGSFTWTAVCGQLLSIVADCDSEVTESNETDNVFQNDRFSCTSRNLKADSIISSLGGGEVTADISYNYYFNFSLEGVADLSNVRIKMGIVGGEVLYDQTFPNLGITRSVNASTALRAGSYTIYAELDPDNRISESNESDNRVELAIRATSGTSDDRHTPSLPSLSSKNNYQISIINKKALEKAVFHPSTDVVIQGTLVNSGNKTVVVAHVPIRLIEENLTTHTTRTIYEETINLAPNASQKLKIHWIPVAAGKTRLTLGINSIGGDAVPTDDKDQVTVKVQ